MSSTTQTTQINAQFKPRRAVDIAREMNAKPPEAVFDACWRDGELAMLFGEAGSGKSLLAVQIGDSIARGRASLPPMQNAECTMNNSKPRRRKVLYVDLVLSDRQFSARYGRYRFSANLYRDRPESTANLAAWVRTSILNEGFTAVIVDDLSMVSLTDDGTRETLRLMRELREITVETGVPILVLADSFAPRWDREVSELTLRRSRVLCGVADSVFAIGTTTSASGHPSSSRRGVGVDGESRVIVQTRSRSGELVWTHSRPLWGDIKRLENGLLGFELTAQVDEEEGEDSGRDVVEMHDEEDMTFRAIAAELGISKSTAQRLYKEHKAETEDEREDRERRIEEARAHDAELKAWTDSGGLITYDYDQKRWVKGGRREDYGWPPKESGESGESGESRESGGQAADDTVLTDFRDLPHSRDSETPDSQHSLDSRKITDLEQAWDDYGREIFVEEWQSHTHKPSVWYKHGPQGFSKHTRSTWGTTIRRLEPEMEFC